MAATDDDSDEFNLDFTSRSGPQLITFMLGEEEYGVDILRARELITYFDPDIRQIVLNRLAGYLDDGGWLVLSVTEIGYEIPDLVKVRGNIFRRQAMAA